jgi:tRNA 2-thiouridine synthesizing protein A
MADPVLEIDARGHRCPTPTLRLQTALRALPAGAEVRLLADDPMARIDVPHFAGQNGHVVVSAKAEGPVLTFVVSKG